jgi:hypothetical protein
MPVLIEVDRVCLREEVARRLWKAGGLGTDGGLAEVRNFRRRNGRLKPETCKR